MDLLRRRSSGELAEILGSAVLPGDRRARAHRFRHLARENLAVAATDERALLEAYAEGVNAGLASLGGEPPEYLAMRAEPQTWLPEDSILATLAMYQDLQDFGDVRESAIGLAHDLLPAELFAFLAAAGDEWDAPLLGEPLPRAPIPGPEVIDLRDADAEATSWRRATPFDETPFIAVGSNHWAVAGTHTASGTALVVNDMHLGHLLPNVWYRARIEWTDDGAEQRVTGVTLPGTPMIVAGSNGHVAWGFTNSQGDWADLIVLEIDPEDEGRYRTPDGWRAFDVFEETIPVVGGDAVVETVRWTIWGPVVDEDHQARPRALRWLAHDVPLGTLTLSAVEEATTLEEAIDAANLTGIPTQNLAIGDRNGRIGWTLIGPMPDRFGFDGQIPSSWADGDRGWHGRLAAEAYPRILDPENGRIWSANNRTVDGEWLARIGDGGYAGGARAGQIRDDLLAIESAGVDDMLAVQLDDRALFLERWRTRMLDVLDEDAVAGHPRRQELRLIVRDDWTGHAAVDSVAYRMVRGWRTFLADRVLDALTRPCLEADEEFSARLLGRWEGPLWQLLVDEPAHLLPPGHDSWSGLQLAVIDETLDYFLATDDDRLVDKTWGARNTVLVQHPISLAVPALGRWLDAAPVQLPGDSGMPRVQSVRFGASERFTIPVGQEEHGLFHMPGGQSGHPLSPYYLSGFEDWRDGRASALLPGPAVHTLTLVPG